MPPSTKQIKFQVEAEKYGLQKVKEFARVLASEAKLAAIRRNDSWILISHIDEALETIREKQYRRKTYQQVAIGLGSALFGAFILGFPTELTSGKNGFILLLYVAMGVAGTAIAMWVSPAVKR